MPLTQWYTYSQGKQVGPLTDHELREAVRDGRLQPWDHVWHAGLGDRWAEASTVPGLFAPPPLPAAARPAPAPPEAWDPQAPLRLSCAASAGRAWRRTQDVLLRPFRWGVWFALGFSAWLATLGDSGGIPGPGGGEGFEVAMVEWREHPALIPAHVREALANATAPVIAGIVTALVLSLAIGVVVMWLRCRGTFMFLDNVVHGRTSVAYPWRVFRDQGNSLFVWMLVYTLVLWAVVALLVWSAVVTIAMPIIATDSWSGHGTAIAANGVLWGVAAIVFGYVRLFLGGFVVPIMYNEGTRATAAWSRFLGLMGERGGAFAWFGICYGFWLCFVGACVVMLIFSTCGLVLCPLSLPYVRAVLLLPATLFLRCFSLEFLAQFGPEFRMGAGGRE